MKETISTDHTRSVATIPKKTKPGNILNFHSKATPIIESNDVTMSYELSLTYVNFTFSGTRAWSTFYIGVIDKCTLASKVNVIIIYVKKSD